MNFRDFLMYSVVTWWGSIHGPTSLTSSVLIDSRFVPEDKSALQPMFEAMKICQTLHPDPADLSPEEEEDEGEEEEGDERQEEEGMFDDAEEEETPDRPFSSNSQRWTWNEVNKAEHKVYKF